MTKSKINYNKYLFIVDGHSSYANIKFIDNYNICIIIFIFYFCIRCIDYNFFMLLFLFLFVNFYLN